MSETWVVGDIHGRLDLLTKVLNKPQEEDTVVFLGDYIDRGLQSKEVVETLINYKKNRGGETIFLKGNHEEMLFNAINKMPEGFEMWIWNGGAKTYESYSLTGYDIVLPETHLDFFNNLKLFHTEEQENGEVYVFVHGGLDSRQGVKTQLSNPDKDTILWDRSVVQWLKTLKYNLRQEIDNVAIWGGKHTVFVGHSVLHTPLIAKDFVALDTGSFLAPEGGGLTIMNCKTKEYETVK